MEKPTIFTPIQITRHQSLKKFLDQMKKESTFCHHQKYFLGVSHLLSKMPKRQWI